ncbi:putative C-mannosyltransferase DPY19L4 [Pelodytes ibericus]
MEVEDTQVDELRQRNKTSLSEDAGNQNEQPKQNRKLKSTSSKCAAVQRFVELFFGLLAAISSGIGYAIYLSSYHERKFWFSGRRDVEREITFQGDGAVYYAFYKDMLRAPSFERGVFELAYNNKTVPLKTINAVQQMTLYPELITTAMYQMSGSQGAVDPMHFYIAILFILQGIYVTALFVTSWLMSRSWLAGILTVAWFIINRADTTHMEHSIPLRENWALPYFACQVAALTGYLKTNLNFSMQKLCYLLMSSSTYAFIMMWEYSHYLLFIQALALCILDGFSMVQEEKIHEIHKMYVFSVFLGYLLQFENTALLTSPLLSLVVGSMIAKSLQISVKKGTFRAKVLKIMYFYLVFTFAISLHFVVRTVIPQKENRQLLKFLEVKFGLNITKNFTVNWLLCQESFQSPSEDYLMRLTQSSLLPFYVLVLLICLFSIAQGIFRRLRGIALNTKLSPEEGRIGERPEIIYHVIQTLLLGSLAMFFEGMKYLWTPYVCVLAAFGVCSVELWVTIIKWIRLKTLHPVLMALILTTVMPTVIGFSLWRECLPRMVSEFTELEEHYETDTVELMNWIKGQVPLAAVFAGSPQLMGLVKLCTGSMVTSLPLYSDEDLMQRNENVYQIYSMRSADDIYKILTSYKASYIIVEDSICNELVGMKGCRVKDLLDVANDHIVNEDGEIYSQSKYGRFCHEIKMNYSPYVNYFTRVFWNRSYSVYKINTLISFQS